MPAKLILYQQNQKLGLDLKDGAYKIGREKPADIVIPDRTISVNHAELQISGSSATLRDLGSTNGTFVNEQQVRGAMPVKEGDQIRFGGARVALEFPAAVKPVDAAPRPPTPGPTVKMEAAVKQVAAKMSWSTRYLLAGLWPILALLFLFFFIQIYTNSEAEKLRVEARYKTLAAQYAHILVDPAVKTVPAPITDDSMQDVMVLDRNGKMIYPASAGEVGSPVTDPKTGRFKANAKYGLMDVKIPGEDKEHPKEAKSYPIRNGGDLVGFVVAQPTGVTGESTLGTVLLLLFLSALVATIVLFFALRPVTRLVKRDLDGLKLKISPLAQGFVDSLPRSAVVPEANGIADEIEKGFRSQKEAALGAQRPGSQKKKAEYLPYIEDLLDTAKLPYCFVSGDYRFLSYNNEIPKIAELSRAMIGMSIFEGGMTSIQSKQLVQAIADARTSSIGYARLGLTSGGNVREYDVAVRSFNDPASNSPLFGMVFRPIEG